MAEYAIVDHGQIVGFKELDVVPVLAGKPYRQILPVVVVDPPYDATTQVRSGPVLTVLADRVTRTWTVVDKSIDQIEAEKAARFDDTASRLDSTESIFRAIVETIRDEFNRHSARDQEIKDQIALSSSLADFKTRMAGIAPIPQRSIGDLRAAIRNKLA